MGGHGVEESWSDGLATDGTRTCTDSEKTMNREPRELPRRGWKTGGDGQRWVERRFNLGKGGRLVGKWACFAHLFPHDSMQVVDFPLLCRLRDFWLRVDGGELAAKDRKAKRSGIGRTVTGCLASQARHEMGAPVQLFAGAKRGRESSDCFTKVRESPRSFTKVRTDQARKSAMLRIVTGKAYFSPALWSSDIRPQWAGFRFLTIADLTGAGVGEIFFAES